MLVEKTGVLKKGKRDIYPILNSKNKLVYENGNFYIVNPCGTSLTPKYERISGFQNGRAVAFCRGKYLIIDTNGKVVYKSNKLLSLDGDIIRICNRGKCRLINLNGKFLFTSEQAFIEKFFNGFARFKTFDELWGAINLEGKVVIEPKYKYLGRINPDRIVARSVRGYGIIDIKGNIIEPFKYQRIMIKNGKTIIYNPNGEKIQA